jgi:hypothetical protein
VYGCENPFLTIEEECRLRMFKNRMLRKIFCSESDEVTGDWRKLCSEELNDLYFIPSTIQVIKSRRTRMAWHVTYNGERRGAYSVLVGKPDENRQFGRWHRWEDNIKMALKEIRWKGVDSTDLVQDGDR